MASDPIDVLYRDEVVLYADLQGIWLMIMHGPADARRMKRAVPTLTEMSKRYPTGFANITVILPAAGFSMDAATREAAAAVTKAFEREIIADCSVIEGVGFWPATARAILSAVQAMSKTRHPRHVFDSIDSAVSWAVKNSPEPIRSRVDVRAALDAIAAERARTEGGARKG